MTNNNITVQVVRYLDSSDDIDYVRRAVFVDEQGIPESLERDDFEHSSWHFLARYNGELAGTGRLQLDGKVTRVAVLKPWRNRGIASAIMRAVLSTAEEKKLDNLYLNAQTSVVRLYEAFGFVQVGEVFDEAGLEHVKMLKQ